MKSPTVTAIMLVNGRHLMARRALACFRAQTYQAKKLLIFDSGADQWPQTLKDEDEVHVDARAFAGSSIGLLRNAACQLVPQTDLFVHWDSDDWSAPERIAFQIERLIEGRLGVTGFNSMMFWREAPREPWETVNCSCGETYPRSGAPCPKGHEYPSGEAWLYSNPNPWYFLGTSMCYSRETWEKLKFSNEHGENVSEYLHWFGAAIAIDGFPAFDRMIASIHLGNAHRLPYTRELMEASMKQGGEWARTPHMDVECAKRMAL